MAETTPLRIWQLSDTHCYADDASRLIWSPLPVYPNQALMRVLSYLGQQPPCDALVLSGDLAQEEVAATYQRINRLLDNFPAPIYVLPGNHDHPELMQAELSSSHIHLVPQAQLGDWHLLFLDSSRPLHGEGYLTTEKLDTLLNTLSQIPTEEYVVVFLHHHPLPIGSAWMDKMGLQQPEQLWAILTNFPQVKAVAFGHIHTEFVGAVTNRQGQTIAVYGTPATCVQLTHDETCLGFKHANPGWRELELHADGKITTQVHYLEA
ncbi:metallophosphoesterase [uncultured Thiothrix sp.]|uniref:metallophosphoesterase n=1 Tax=uncultured Thiothrix sp. TaxID=223185 RepID=UPI00260C97BC|nr:metallophosphoesterase [uncultured Thiothrix sp.]